jgi:CheY-like chemotaxis protein
MIGTGTNSAHLRRARVLIIEDSRFLRRSLEKILTRDGYDVLAAEDGRQGLDLVRKFRPDAIFLDLMLPIMGGMDVLKTLRSETETNHIPVLVLSGLSGQNSKRVLKDGATVYVEKKELMFTSEGSSSLLGTLRDVLHQASIAHSSRRDPE